jgi:hypothetical protein
MAGSTTDAKVKLANAVLKVRALQSEKYELLLKSADSWESASRNASTTWEVRQIHADRARQARSEAAELAKELGL